MPQPFLFTSRFLVIKVTLSLSEKNSTILLHFWRRRWISSVTALRQGRVHFTGVWRLRRPRPTTDAAFAKFTTAAATTSAGTAGTAGAEELTSCWVDSAILCRKCGDCPYCHNDPYKCNSYAQSYDASHTTDYLLFSKVAGCANDSVHPRHPSLRDE